MITDCLKIVLILIVLVLFYKSLRKENIEDFLNYKRCNTRKLEERLKVIFKEQGAIHITLVKNITKVNV